MNVYDWMKETDNTPPMNEPGTREDPGNRPHVPDEDGDTTRELHSGAGGGRDPVDGEHQTEHTIADPEQTVSNEGVVDSVRKFFKVHNRGKDYIEVDGNAKANGYEVEKLLKNTYANQAWLDKQTHKPGTVKVSDLNKFLNFDKIPATIQETGAINAQFQNAQIQAILVNAKTLGPIFNELDPGKLTDKNYEDLKAALSSIKPITETIKLPSRSKTSLLGGAQPDSREAMALEDVKPTAEAVLKALSDTHSVWVDGGKEIADIMGNYYDLEMFIEKKGRASPGYNNGAWTDLMGAIFRKCFSNGAPEVIAAYRNFEAACIAAVTYMERSFTGGKVSNESFTVSNEGIFDSIKALFAKKPESLDVKWVDESLKKSFDKTLLNDTWLDKQKFTTGDVSVEFPKAAKGDYKALGKAMKAALDEAEAKNIEVGKKHYGKVMEAFKAMNKDIGKRSVAEIQKLRDIANYDDMDFDAPWVEPKQVTSPVGAMAMTALDKVGIKAVANAIIEYSSMLADYNEACMIYLPDNDTHATWRIILENTPDKSKLPLLKEYHDDLDSIYDYSHESFFNQCTGQWELVENLTYGLMRWISKSISGVNFSE